ncbi:threonine/serine exporter ThrE family protein [Microbacterium koreense]|uniref:Threonine/serine exporter ThrE family protein n=1 Tax=Microbacterium koreense TaxID=323761 RepID=A0ABW2ZN62_9MICO
MTSLSDRVRGALSAFRSPTVPSAAPPDEPGDVPEMLGVIGAALLSSAQATSDVEDTLRRVAARYDNPHIRVFVLPTLVLVEDAGVTPPQTSIFPAVKETLRLDQAGEVDHTVRRALADRPGPRHVIDEIQHATTLPPRFGWVLGILGYLLLTMGFGLVLNPTASALPIYLVLGLVVGTIVKIGARFPTLSLILPVATAFTVTLLVAKLASPLVHDDVLRLVAPSFVSFLPGLTLTVAAVELTAGQVMAGASRMVFGFARLGLLAFGVYAGLSVAGASAPVDGHPDTLGAWAPWAGIALVAIGFYLYSTAPRRSLIWILYALIVAYSAQLLGSLLVGAELSGLVGALIVVPAVRLVGQLRSAPPPAVMLTCAYWLLVPGSMGFIGLSEAAAGSAGATDTILQTLGSLLAIAIGMMLGAGLSKDAVAMVRGWKAHPLTGADRV